MRCLVLLLALLLPALPAAAQDACGGAIRVERFENRLGPDGRPQVFAIIRNGGSSFLGVQVARTPVPGLEGMPPSGFSILPPGAARHILLGTARPGSAIPEARLRDAIHLTCRL